VRSWVPRELCWLRWRRPVLPPVPRSAAQGLLCHRRSRPPAGSTLRPEAPRVRVSSPPPTASLHGHDRARPLDGDGSAAIIARPPREKPCPTTPLPEWSGSRRMSTTCCARRLKGPRSWESCAGQPTCSTRSPARDGRDASSTSTGSTSPRANYRACRPSGGVSTGLSEQPRPTARAPATGAAGCGSERSPGQGLADEFGGAHGPAMGSEVKAGCRVPRRAAGAKASAGSS
jgi:hypothetical protein